MKLKTYLKSAIAGFTAFAMAVTMVPRQPPPMEI